MASCNSWAYSIDMHLIMGIDKDSLRWDDGDRAMKLNQAYRRAVRAAHPDTGGDTAAFQRLQAVYRIFSDAGEYTLWYHWVTQHPAPAATPETAPAEAAPDPWFQLEERSRLTLEARHTAAVINKEWLNGGKRSTKKYKVVAERKVALRALKTAHSTGEFFKDTIQNIADACATLSCRAIVGRHAEDHVARRVRLRPRSTCRLRQPPISCRDPSLVPRGPTHLHGPPRRR